MHTSVVSVVAIPAGHWCSCHGTGIRARRTAAHRHGTHVTCVCMCMIVGRVGEILVCKNRDRKSVKFNGSETLGFTLRQISFGRAVPRFKNNIPKHLIKTLTNHNKKQFNANKRTSTSVGPAEHAHTRLVD